MYFSKLEGDKSQMSAPASHPQLFPFWFLPTYIFWWASSASPRGPATSQGCRKEYAEPQSPTRRGWSGIELSTVQTQPPGTAQEWACPLSCNTPLCHLGLPTSTLWAQSQILGFCLSLTISHSPYCLPQSPKLPWKSNPKWNNPLLIISWAPHGNRKGLHESLMLFAKCFQFSALNLPSH